MLAVSLSLVAPAIPLPAVTLSKQLSDAAMPFEGHELPHAVPHTSNRSAALDQWGDHAGVHMKTRCRISMAPQRLRTVPPCNTRLGAAPQQGVFS